MKKTFSILAFLSFVLFTKAQTSNIQFTTSVEGVKQYTLKNNGLKILLIPDNSSSNITVNIVYEVGSRHEGYGETGMAHLLEHMLFRSCKNFTDIKKAIADKGAFANGTTYFDRTNYYEILSASDSNLNWAIAMEADRMVNAKILQSELDAEFSVVRNEFEIGENYPTSILDERIQSTMYLWHNYGKSTIGSKEDIERVKAERLKVFYQKFYQPDNATLVIGGKFDEKKALEYIENYFGSIPKPTRILEQTYTVEPPQDGERNVELRRNGDMQYLGFAYHTPSLASADYAINDAVIELLTNNPSGILYKNFVETKLANRVSGYSPGLRDASFSVFQLAISKDKDVTEIENKLFSILNNIDTITISNADVERAKNSLIKYWDNITNNTQRLTTNFADIIGAGDWRLWYIYRDNIEKLNVADIKRVLKTYYKKSNRTWGKFIPEKEPQRVSIPEITDIAAIVKDYKGKEIIATENYNINIDTIIAKASYNKTSNGAKYIVFSKPTKSDVISVRIKMNLGNESSLQNTAKRNEILAKLLSEGTKTKTKSEINDALDKLKTDLQIYGNSDVLTISIKTQKSSFNDVMKIVNDILQNPIFNEKDFNRIISESIAAYEEYQNDPQQIAFSTVDKYSTNYPKSHPFFASDVKEDIETFKNMKLNDVISFYNNFLGGNNVIASFVGACNNKDITKNMQTIFGAWNAKTTYTKINEIHFNIAGKTENILIPDKSNATCAGRINVAISQKDIDFPAVYMANELLGGGAFLSSRIPNRLREKDGFSYGAGSNFSADDNNKKATWNLYAFFNPIYRTKLDSALLDEINKAINVGFTADELQKSKESWLQGEQTALGMDAQLNYILLDYLEKNKNLKEYKIFQEKIKNVSLLQVNNAMKKYFDTQKLILIYAGDFIKK